MITRSWVGVWLLLAIPACGDSSGPMLDSGVGATTASDSTGVAATDELPASDTTASVDGSDDGTGTLDPGGTTAADGSTTDAGDTTGADLPPGLEEVGSLVVLGDSIGDGGGQGRYYYDLLRDDLTAHYGPIEYVNNADSGSQTGALLGQVDGLPAALPGPVVVVITSGGNDMKDDLLPVILGTDGPLIAQMQANIDAALGALLAPDRFGPGVAVYVYEGNIYDASDGAGDFGSAGCNFAGGLPAIPSDGFFQRWNDGIRDAVEVRDQIAVDMHEYFYGHGYHADPSWYASDCTHPNALGHAELRSLFYEHITGESLP